MKKNIPPFILLFTFLSFVLLTSQKCSESKKELLESNVYPVNPIDFSQSMRQRELVNKERMSPGYLKVLV